MGKINVRLNKPVYCGAAILDLSKHLQASSNLMDKKSMVLHAKSLQQYLSQGMKLKKIHRGIKFKEEAFMKPFIELNTKMRTAAKNDLKKKFTN